MPAIAGIRVPMLVTGMVRTDLRQRSHLQCPNRFRQSSGSRLIHADTGVRESDQGLTADSCNDDVVHLATRKRLYWITVSVDMTEVRVGDHLVGLIGALNEREVWGRSVMSANRTVKTSTLHDWNGNSHDCPFSFSVLVLRSTGSDVRSDSTVFQALPRRWNPAPCCAPFPRLCPQPQGPIPRPCPVPIGPVPSPRGMVGSPFHWMFPPSIRSALPWTSASATFRLALSTIRAKVARETLISCAACS